MKIELDLDEILGGEESIREQVVNMISNEVQSGLKKKLDSEVARVINESLAKAVGDKMPELVNAVLETPYIPVDRWGDRDFGSKPTTFRAQLVKSINEQMVYSKKTFSSDENAFTRAVDAVVSANISTFKAAFDKIVHEKFTNEAFAYATGQLKKKLGVA